ncbi:MAG TPA: hypothetical protein VF584_06725 [Longimicrobium sp.]|jgi:hypothetical protein
MISGSFSRVLMLGTLFPVTVFALLFYRIVVPFLPADLALFQILGTLDTAWTTALISLLLLLISGILYNLNIPIIRLYEGYPWQDSWLGGWAQKRQLAQLEWTIAKRTELEGLVEELEDADPKDPAIAELTNLITLLTQRETNEYPKAPYVLPTRLGNVIRSFEEYPRNVYGISAITVWPRLVGVVNKEYAATLDESKATFDFMINASFLGGVLAASTLVAGLLVPHQIELWTWVAQLATSAITAYLFYRGSVGAAAAWGAHVSSAFDLFRWDLLKKLGYARPSMSPAEEQALWIEISTRMLYGPPPADTSLQPYYSAAKKLFED